MILKFSVIILLLSSASAAPTDATDAFLSMLEKANLLAATVAVSKDDSIAGVAFSKGYGMANYALGVKMKPKHRMTIGSNTKFMTSVSIFQLHQRGLLNVDDPVSKYLAPADFGRPANWTWCPRVYNTTGTKCTVPTIRHTLSMASGVVRVDNCPYTPDMWQYKLCIDQQPGGKAMGNDVYLTIVGQIPIIPYIKLVLDAPLEFAPGTSYAYSNPGWWLASYIVEKLSGMPLNLYYQKYLWDPSGMTNTYYGVGLDTYSVHPNSIAGIGYANLFAPFGALLTVPQYGGFMIDPRQAKGVGTLRLPPSAPAGTFQGTLQSPWYSGELGMGNGAGAVVSDSADMIKWFKTFIAKPDRLGLNATTLKNMFSYYNPYSALPSGAVEGNKTNIMGYFGPGIAVVPGAGGLHGMSQLMYQGDIAGVACRIHIRLRGAHPSNSTVIVYFVPLVPAIPIPPNGTKDCLVKDPLAPTKPAERLPQLLCDVTAWPTFTVYLASNLTKIWGF